MRLRISGIIALACLSTFAGCMCSSAPSRVEAPDFDPGSAASEAFTLYDGDGDGKIAGEELGQAGSIASGLEFIDSDGDGDVSQAELEAILTSIADGGVGRTTFSLQVLLDGSPLEGATLTFTPEPFMQDALLPGVGTTDGNGTATVATDPTQLDDQTLAGTIQPGFYRLEVTHPQMNLPAKFNTKSTLGQVISQEANREGTVVMRLESQ